MRLGVCKCPQDNVGPHQGHHSLFSWLHSAPDVICKDYVHLLALWDREAGLVGGASFIGGGRAGLRANNVLWGSHLIVFMVFLGGFGQCCFGWLSVFF